ncbi:MAG TPA: Wzz/FepE/Etk N-terminal domain-containing protein [Acidobacteriaceae bacterium]|nr:Wzz/FepE/Etk N-terminal domain-containing protein [Acidobacteriaceae bacterium]
MVDIVSIVRDLWQGRWMILWLMAGCAAIATGVAFLLPFKYTSTASFIPPNLGSGSSMASAMAGQLAAFGAGDLLGGVKSPSELYAGILQSRSIADELIDKNHLMQIYRAKKRSQAESILGGATAVTIEPKSSIVTVAVTDRDPKLAQTLANDYMTALEETNGRLALTQASQRARFFGDQLEKEKDALENAEVELKKTQEKSGLIAPSGQTETEIRTIADTQAQIAARQVQLAALRQSATDENPEVIRLKSEISDLEGQMSRMQIGSGKGSPVTIPTSKVPELQLDYVRKEREVRYHEALFEILSKQYEAAKLDDERDAPLLQVLDSASYPDTKSSPKRMYYMLGGLVFGFFAGCTWILTREHLRALRKAVTAASE